LLQALSSSSSNPLSRPPLSLVLHIGDLAYAKGYDYQWDSFFTQNEKIMKVSFLPSLPSYPLSLFLSFPRFLPFFL